MRRISSLLLAGALAACGGAARWVDEAAAANARADAFVASGDLERAIAVLEELVARPVPAQVAAQDRRAVFQDAYARLASLALEVGQPSRALRFADAGLALGEGRDVFTSALHTFRGRAHEVLKRDADAVRDYEAAQMVAEELLRRTLSDGGAP